MNTNRRVYRNCVASTIAPDHFLKRKVGGTKVGNFLRSIAREKTGGILGSGALMKKSEPVKVLMPTLTNQTSIAERVNATTAESILKGIANLSQGVKKQLIEDQTSAASLPKTKQLRDAEKLAEKMYNNPVVTDSPVSVMSTGMKFSPMYIAGVIIAVIVLIVVIKKAA